MQYALVALTSSLILAGSALADDHIHQVTAGPGTVFEPNSIEAEDGDWVSVSFPSGHDIVQSSFDAPCVPLEDGISSGTPESGATFTFQVNGTGPMWFYCSVGQHCQSGMTFAINPTSERTIEAYTEAAADTSSSEAPAEDGPLNGTYDDPEEASHSDDDSSASSTASDAATSASETGSAASESADSGASGLHASFGMVAGLIAAGAAFVL